MPSNYPAGFVPDKQQLPPGFVPDGEDESKKLTEQTQAAAKAAGATTVPLAKQTPPGARDMKGSPTFGYPTAEMYQGAQLEQEGKAPPPPEVKGEPLAVPLSAARMPLVQGLKLLGKGAVGATAGAIGGGYGGAEIGNIFGQRDIGRKIGAAGGALVGGYAGVRGGNPEAARYEEMGNSAQYRDVARDAMRPEAPAVDPVAQAVKARTAHWIPTKVTPPGEAPLPMPMQAHAEMEADIAAGRLGRAGARQEMHQDLAAARNARTEDIAPADAALLRNPAPIAPRTNAPAWKTVQAPEAPIPAPTRASVQKVPEPPWITRAAQKAQGVSEGTPATRPGTPRTAIPEARPTSTEEFLTNLVKKPIWTPEDSVDVRNAFGRDGLMRPGEGQTQYRARLMGMIRSSRAAQGMTDIESYPAPKRPR